MKEGFARGTGTPGAGKTGGFTLFEVILTISILSLVAMSTALLLVPMARQSRIQRETETANMVARDILESIQSTPFTDILALYPQSSTVDIPELPDGRITITYEDPNADPLLIQAELTWDSPELGSMQRIFNTVRTE